MALTLEQQLSIAEHLVFDKFAEDDCSAMWKDDYFLIKALGVSRDDLTAFIYRGDVLEQANGCLAAIRTLIRESYQSILTRTEQNAD